MLNSKKKKNPYFSLDLADAIAFVFAIAVFCVFTVNSGIKQQAKADEIPAQHVVQMSDEEMRVVSKACLNVDDAEEIEYTMVFEDNMQRRYEFMVSPAMYNLYKIGDIINLSCSVTMNARI